MARVENYKKTSLRHVINENIRKLQNYKNAVDLDRSDSNYTYGVSDANECVQAVNKRVNDIMAGRNVQTQTTVASEWLITCPKQLAGRDKEFFDTVWEFCNERYGEQNVISGFVHMDETTPHMHMLFVPEATSRKTGKKTVSSASLLTKSELSTFHDDLDKRCEEVFGVPHLIRNGKTVGDNLSVSNLRDMQAELDRRYKAEIASYRDFLQSKYVKDGRSLLEVYEAHQAASKAAKDKVRLNPVPQSLGQPVKPAEVDRTPKHTGKVQVSTETRTVQESASPKQPNSYHTNYDAIRLQAQRAMQAKNMINSEQNEDSEEFQR